MCEKDEDAGFVVGQTVYAISFGKGVVVDILPNPCNTSFPVTVRFGSPENGIMQTYTRKGSYRRGEARTLFFAPIIIRPEHTTPPAPQRPPVESILKRQ